MNKEPWQRKECPNNKKYKECNGHLQELDKEKYELYRCSTRGKDCFMLGIPNIPWYEYAMWFPKPKGMHFPMSNKFKIKYSKTHWSLKILLQIYWRYKYIKFIIVKIYRQYKTKLYRKIVGFPTVDMEEAKVKGYVILSNWKYYLTHTEILNRIKQIQPKEDAEYIEDVIKNESNWTRNHFNFLKYAL